MKQKSAAAMPRCLLSLLLLVTAGAKRSRSHGETVQGSVDQIRDTLHDLQRSIQDSSKEVDSLFSGRQTWCDEYVHSFTAKQVAAKTELHRMETEALEKAAEAKEIEASALQLKADIAILQHTLNKTRELQSMETNAADKLAITSLVQNKEQTLAVLEGEEEIILPLLAQLRAGAVELRQRARDQSDSLGKERQLVSSLRDACEKSAVRAQSQATAHASTATPIAAAIQGLQEMDKRIAAALPEVVPPSFLQMSQEQAIASGEEDLLSVFGGSVPAEMPFKVEEQPIQKHEAKKATAELQKPTIKRLLEDLREAKQPRDNDHEAWCASEEAAHERVKLLAEASIGEAEAESGMHLAETRSIQARLKEVDESLLSMQAMSKAFDASFSKEKALMKSSLKDQALATKILQQAKDILDDLKATQSLSVPGEESAAENVTLALHAAAVAFKGQSGSSAVMEQEVSDASQRLLTQVQDAQGSLMHEQSNLELALDAHGAELRRCNESTAMYESDIKDAGIILQSLATECHSNIHTLEEQEKTAEMWALQDSQAVLEGRTPPNRFASAPSSLRGSADSKPLGSLSPLQRAAAEMGVAVEGG